MELLAVVTIIGIFVALGLPTMGGVMQDRHASRAAEEIANLFRIARSRAAATGAAHRVLANTGTPAAGTFELRTALTVVGGPTSSCVTPMWTDTDSRVLNLLEFGPTAAGSFGGRGIEIKAIADSGGTAPTLGETCFTPGGMTWVRLSGGAWKRPPGYQATGWQIYRTSLGAITGLVRSVRVSPTGLISIEAK